MRMQIVSSSNLRAVGYDPATKVLRIEFHNGVYDYFNVPEEIYIGLLRAPSKGSFHHSYIKALQIQACFLVNV